MKISKLVLAFVFLFLLTACTNRPTGGIPNGSKVVLSEDESQNINLKLKYYNKNCIDVFSESLRLLHKDYVMAVHSYSGPLNEENVPSLFELDSSADCALAIQKAKELNLVVELDPLAENYLSALKNASLLVAQANQYYLRMDYKKDGFAEGMALHSKLLNAFEGFEQADDALKENILKTQTTLDLGFLKKYQAEGRSFEFLVQDAWIKGTAVLNKAEASDYDSLDTEAFSILVDQYQLSLDDLDVYLADHPQEAYVAEAFQEGARDYMKEVRDLLNRKKEDLPYDQFEGNAKLMRDQYDWWEDEYFL